MLTLCDVRGANACTYEQTLASPNGTEHFTSEKDSGHSGYPAVIPVSLAPMPESFWENDNASSASGPSAKQAMKRLAALPTSPAATFAASQAESYPVHLTHLTQESLEMLRALLREEIVSALSMEPAPSHPSESMCDISGGLPHLLPRRPNRKTKSKKSGASSVDLSRDVSGTVPLWSADESLVYSQCLDSSLESKGQHSREREFCKDHRREPTQIIPDASPVALDKAYAETGHELENHSIAVVQAAIKPTGSQGDAIVNGRDSRTSLSKLPRPSLTTQEQLQRQTRVDVLNQLMPSSSIKRRSFIDPWNSLQVHEPKQTARVALVGQSGNDTFLCCSRALHPEGHIRVLWNALALLMFVADVLLVSFEWAFAMQREHASYGRLKAVGLFSCCFWIADMVMNFLTGYLERETCIMILSPRLAIMHYLRSWFLVDLMTLAGPVLYYILLLEQILRDDDGGDNTNLSRQLMMLRLCKLGRLGRAGKMHLLRKRFMLWMSQRRSQTVVAIIGIVQILIMLFVGTHLGACVLWQMGRRSVEAGVDGSWVTTGMDSELVRSRDIAKQYVSALMLSGNVLCGVGMGGFDSAVTHEIAVISAITLLGMVTLSIIINEVASIYAKASESNVAVQALLSEAASFMSMYDVPTDLQSRVENYLQTVFEHRSREAFGDSLRGWLKDSGTLLAELNSSTFGPILKDHPQLGALPSDVLARVADICETALLPPGELVCCPGVPPARLVFVRSGVMEYSWRAGAAEREIVLRFSSKTVDKTRTSRRASWLHGDSATHIEELCVGDLLFHKSLLLPPQDSGDSVCVCRSFCEVLTLEITSFRDMMKDEHPTWLHTLQALAAIDADSPDALAWALDQADAKATDKFLLCRPLLDASRDSGQSQTRTKRETALHASAREGAVACIRWLITNNDVAPGVGDSNGSTALAAAQAAQQQASVEALIACGATVVPEGCEQDVSWTVLRRHCAQEAEDAVSVDTTVGELQCILQQAGVPVETWQEERDDRASRLTELCREVQQGTCKILGASASDGTRLRRIAHVVRAKIVACCSGGAEKVLNVTEDARWWSQGGNPGSVTRLPAKRIRAAGFEQSLQDLWVKDLTLSAELVEKHFERGTTTVYEENKDSGTYSGLRCIYVVHEVVYWWRGLSLGENASRPIDEVYKHFALPHGGIFETMQGNGKKQLFVWLPAQWPVLQVEDLRARFEFAGLNPSAWRSVNGVEGITELQQELQRGLCSLMSEADESFVRITQILRLRIQVHEDSGTSSTSSAPKQWTLHQASRAQRVGSGSLPWRTIHDGHFEQALNSLWVDLVGAAAEPELVGSQAAAPPPPSADECFLQLSLPDILNQLERGAASTYEEVVAYDDNQCMELEDAKDDAETVAAPAAPRYPGLRTVRIVHEVKYSCCRSSPSGRQTSSIDAGTYSPSDDCIRFTKTNSRSLFWLPSI